MNDNVEKLRLLACYDNISSLSILRTHLESEDIKCYTENENYKYSIGSFAEGIELYVLEEDYDKAKAILEKTSGEI
jgi:hypothetical protein